MRYVLRPVRWLGEKVRKTLGDIFEAALYALVSAGVVGLLVWLGRDEIAQFFE